MPRLKSNVKEGKYEMSQGTHNGFQIFLENADRKNVEGLVEDLLKESTKKPSIEKMGKKEIKVDDIVINGVSDQPVDVYFVFDESKQRLTVTGFFDMGTAYLSSASFPANFRSGEKFMRRIGIRLQKQALAEKIEEASSAMSQLERDKSNLEKEKSKLESSIKDCESTIANAKDDLKANASEQESKAREMGEQKKQLEMLQKSMDGIKEE
ncbi:MAG TPA: hypothetical protein DHW15_05795 [Bacteroidetes bacterium]|jgi:hypothetical protein|nr:MAG: hypothetical protein ABR94_11540 [Sphingobacteriales bacterium BACL12 MAG-120802-bin5]KRP13902.1 MAG: hypothetical protein ABR95_12560 [Sphingobacteriales bacterium BACL12 MAG-120813-bin55]HCK21673.1 hypothetical protein [Bacteroidota bacterium]